MTRADTPEMRAAMLSLVGQLQPVRAHKLLSRFRKDYGVSHRVANETFLRMIHDRSLRRTFTGKVKLPQA